MPKKTPISEPLAETESPVVEKDRSADVTPQILDSEDLERVLSDKKEEPHEWLSEEARKQIEPKLRRKQAA